MVQRGHAYAIVDEVDSILIDEARTPLIISGKGEDSSVMYKLSLIHIYWSSRARNLTTFILPVKWWRPRLSGDSCPLILL